MAAGQWRRGMARGRKEEGEGGRGWERTTWEEGDDNRTAETADEERKWRVRRRAMMVLARGGELTAPIWGAGVGFTLFRESGGSGCYEYPKIHGMQWLLSRCECRSSDTVTEDRESGTPLKQNMGDKSTTGDESNVCQSVFSPILSSDDCRRWESGNRMKQGSHFV
eukprot:753000-Hanusia_phi.AAC.1